MTKNQRVLGVGRLLITVYGILATAASVRAAYQLARKFDEAPLAYSLSAVSALVYILATIALAKSGSAAGRLVWHRVALITVWFELIGVVIVGSLSLIHPEIFQHSSVWSLFGIGYGFIPLALPILGLVWLRKQTKRG